MSHRSDDLRMLNELLDKHVDELSEREVEAFAGMRFDLQTDRHDDLTDKQRSWLTSVHERIVPTYANLVSRGLAPRGKEVPSMVGALPKRPPPMPKEPERPGRATAEHRPFRMVGLDDEDSD